jgi:sporulation protein YlmC with PRC-barrel domain
MQETHTHTGGAGGARPEHPLIPAERVNGTKVFNREGEKIGHVEDIAIDKLSGKVAYAILSFGGFLGAGERYHPVPWSLLKYDTEQRGYVIPCDKQQLEEAPSFEADDLSGWDDRDIREGIYSYYGAYGVTPYWAGL